MRVGSALALLVLLWASSGAMLAQSTQKGAHSSIAIAISTPQTEVSAGSDITLSVVLTNISGQDLGITFDNGARGEFDYTISVLDGKGREPSETKYYRAATGKNASDPGEATTLVVAPSSGLRLLKPGGTFKSSIILRKLYDLQIGKYTIQVERIDAKSQTMVKSNMITVVVSR